MAQFGEDCAAQVRLEAAGLQGALHVLAGEEPVAAKLEPGVDGCNVGGVAAELTAGEHHAETGAAAEDPLQPAGKNLRVIAKKGTAQRLNLPGSAIINAKKTNLPIADLAGQTQTILRIDDA